MQNTMPTTPEFDADDFDMFEGELESQEPRNGMGRLAGDEKLQVKFYKKAILHKPLSKENQRMMYVDADFIEIIIPGKRELIIDEIAHKAYKKRFKVDWEKYQAGAKVSKQGTPLDLWNGVTPAQVSELKYYNVTTVEELATMSDSTSTNFMGGHELKRKAIMFMEASKEGETDRKLAAALEASNAEIAALKSQMAMIIESTKKSDTAKAKVAKDE